MKTSTLAIAALALTQGVTGAAAQIAPNGDPVLYWNQVAIANIYGDPTTIYGDPGLGGRAYAIVNIALHDSINATMGSPDRSYVGKVAASSGSTQAAAAVAAHDVLVNLYPIHAAAIDAALQASLATIADGPAKTAGIATGQAYASAALVNRANDGFIAPAPPYTPTGQPGNYVGPAIDGQFATATPFVLTSPSQFRPGPPPALDSAAYAASLNSVEAIGSFSSATRTPGETFSAKFWANNPETPYLMAAISQSVADGKSVLDNARIFATLTTAIADAPLVAFDAKYRYNFWRPITAIQMADTDGNPATTAAPTWQPLLPTPPFPSYFSAHSIVAGTAASILDLEYGSNHPFSFTNAVGTGHWDSYDAAATDDSMSREWGGLHFNFDDSVGLSTGYKVGAFAFAANVFSSGVPEPTTWALMLAGFAMVGAGLRSKRTRVAFAC